MGLAGATRGTEVEEERMRRTKVVLALVAGMGLCLSMAAAAAQATNQPPTVSAARTRRATCASGVPIAFTATASDPDGDTLTYLWDFGDGTTSTEQNPTKAYPGRGHRTAAVTVSDGKEGGTVTSAPLSVVVQANRNPSANGLTMTPQAGFAPLTCQLGGRGAPTPTGRATCSATLGPRR